MADNTCITCGRVIPEGRHICLACGDYDDMQTFEPRTPKITTNADAIRAMSLEQLTVLLLSIEHQALKRGSKTPLRKMHEWLESEVSKP